MDLRESWLLRFCHDHTPHFATDDNGDKGVAFAVGYMRCCIQAVWAEHVRRGPDMPASYNQKL